MMKENCNENSDFVSESTHRCCWPCLGPLTFHSQAAGNKVNLSHGCRRAKRNRDTFKNGVVFTSRPVKPMEKIRLRVEKDVSNWHGGLRVGFTNVPPSSKSLPLPAMAIPNLTDTPGHWAAPVHESLCSQGSELEFWVSSGGSIYVSGHNSNKHKLKTGVDLSRPLWAMIDVYGNTCSILLLGSKKVTWSITKTSCPVPEHLTSPVNPHNWSNSDMSQYGSSEETTYFLEMEDGTDESSTLDCVVCMGKRARITLPCGHRCLCIYCSPRVRKEFGCCPLCRGQI